jgi:hypothetical protein
MENFQLREITKNLGQFAPRIKKKPLPSRWGLLV